MNYEKRQRLLQASQRRRLLQCLVQLREAVPKLKLREPHHRFSYRVGICGNVHKYLNVQSDESIYLADLMRQWEGKATFTCMYPVGGPKEYNMESLSQTHWLNPRRLELLDWLIEELQK